MSQVDSPTASVGFPKVDPDLLGDVNPQASGRVASLKDATTARFASAFGFIRHAPRNIKRGVLYAKDHPGMVWNQTRGITLLAGSITFLWLLFNYVFLLNPIVGAFVLLMSLGLLVVTGSSALQQVRFSQALRDSIPG